MRGGRRKNKLASSSSFKLRWRDYSPAQHGQHRRKEETCRASAAADHTRHAAAKQKSMSSDPVRKSEDSEGRVNSLASVEGLIIEYRCPE